MFKVLKGCKKPERATKLSSCIDLFASEDIQIGVGDTKIVPLGVIIDLEALYRSWFRDTYQNKDRETWNRFLKSHCLELKPRSSLTRMKNKEKPQYKHLHIANGVGEIDLDYPDEIGIILHNPMTVDAVMIFNEICEKKRSGNSRNEIDFHLDKYNKKLVTVIKKGDKIAQIKLVPHKSYLMDCESKTQRKGGYGSSGK